MSRPSSTGPSANKPCSKQPPPPPQTPHAPSPAAPPAAATISAAGPGSSAVPAAAAVISAPGAGGGAGPVSPQHHELTSLFECPVCFDYVLPPILQCQAGHLVCNQCRQKLSCCPTCRGALTPSIRNLAMEKVASAVLFPCKVSPATTRKPVKRPSRVPVSSSTLEGPSVSVSLCLSLPLCLSLSLVLVHAHACACIPCPLFPCPPVHFGN